VQDAADGQRRLRPRRPHTQWPEHLAVLSATSRRACQPTIRREGANVFGADRLHSGT